MKQLTIERFNKWKLSAKSKDKFTTNGEKYTVSEFEALIGHKPSKVVKPAINTIEDIQEEEYADLEDKADSGNTEES
tara:strand:+ start:302 stop:532 length:231 start_codon:yes stop_codon:yes gene_type:complete